MVKSAFAMMSVALLGGLIIILTHACAGESRANTGAGRAFSGEAAAPAAGSAQNPSGAR